MPEFDFIVIGAGSAGCVVAERLSRSGRHSVAVIEAGGDDRRFFVQMPLGYGKIFYDRSLNWSYMAEPDPGLANQADYWPRGRVLGGSGSLNAMVWLRGAAADYDDWAAEGNPGWAWADVMPVFRAMEHNQAGASALRGQGGPLHVTDVRRDAHPMALRFLDAAMQAGFPPNPDFNGPTQEGVGIYQINTRGGWRCSAATAFLRPALARPNLALFTHSQATRIVIENHRATGVEITRGDHTEVLHARCQVILCAGAVNSPVLLQRSGIGPAAHLASLGIPVIRDAPAIGHHLQDHVGVNYIYRARVPTLNQILRPWWGRLLAGAQFLLTGGGPLALSLNQGGGFVRSSPSRPRPNVQLYVQALTTLTGKGTKERPLLHPDPFPGYALGLTSCRPASRGSILARSADPFAAPIIRPNAFSHPADVAEMHEAVKLLRLLASQPALAAVTEAELAPGPDIVTNDDLEADFRQRSGTCYHPCGTVRMGSDPAHSGVDARLMVHGLEGLRVIDASIFPIIPSGNINGPTMMVGAKGAAMALQDAG